MSNSNKKFKMMAILVVGLFVLTVFSGIGGQMIATSQGNRTNSLEQTNMVSTSKALSLTLYPTVTAAATGDKVVIFANVTYDGKGIPNAIVNFTTNDGNSFIPTIITTNSTGIGYTIYSITSSTESTGTISATANLTGYENATATTRITDTGSSNNLVVSINLASSVVSAGSTNVIYGTVTESGKAVSGASITISSPVNPIFSPISATTDSSGVYYVDFTASNNSAVTYKEISIIEARASDTNYGSSSSDVAISVEPLGHKYLSVNILPVNPTNPIENGYMTVTAKVLYDGVPMAGATVTFTDSFNSVFSTVSTVTNSSGLISASVHLSNSNAGYDIITASASMSGYTTSTGESYVYVSSHTSNQLVITATLGTSTTTGNSTDVICGTVYVGSSQLTGALVSVSDTAGSYFYSTSTTSGSSGSFYIEFKAAAVTTKTNDIITLTASNSGDITGSSSIILTILPVNSLTLSVKVKINPSTGIVSGGQAVALINVTADGHPVSNSTISLSDSMGSTFSPSTVITNSKGMAYVPFNLPSNNGGGIDLIKAVSSRAGYNSTTAYNYFYVISGTTSSNIFVTMSLESGSISPGSIVILTGSTYTNSPNYGYYGGIVGWHTSSQGGVTVSFTDTAGSTFSVPTVVSSSSGSFTTTLTVPKDFTGNYDVITASISLTGKTSSSSSVLLTISNGISGINFLENGLKSGTQWNVVFDGQSQSSSSNSISYNVPNGNYTYTVCPVTGYEMNPSNGTVKVLNSGTQVTITFKEVDFPVIFTESGLSSGTTWKVDLSGSTKSSTSNTITFNEMNGSYDYKVLGVSGYSISNSKGTFTSNGGYKIYVTFQQIFYTAELNETGLPSGYHWSATLGTYTLSSSSNIIPFTIPNGTYSYSVNAIDGYKIQNRTGTITVSGANVTQRITFTSTLFVEHYVIFRASGLAPYATWTLDVNGNTSYNTQDSINMSLPAGKYVYNANATGYITKESSGTFNISNTNITVNIVFSLNKKYSIEFLEYGLTSGQQWNITMNGVFNQSTGSSIYYYETNGNYSYIVQAPAGYTASPNSQTISVSNNNITVGINFQKVTVTVHPSKYSVMFIETGLNSGTQWYVTFNGTLFSSSTNSISDLVLNGTYAYNVSSVNGYTESPLSGYVTISGQNEIVGINFQKVTVHKNVGYNVTFVETGLPSGTSWNVIFNGKPLTSTGSPIVITELNGTYSYSVAGISGYSISPKSGSVSVDGQNVVIGVNFYKQTSVTTPPSQAAPGSSVLGIPMTYILLGLISASLIIGAGVMILVRKR